jgi:hypothetical protein
VDKLYRAGILNGIGLNVISPLIVATRAEAAAIIHRFREALSANRA